jgi:hypothetical protein
MKKILIYLGGLLVAFGAGYVPLYFKMMKLEDASRDQLRQAESKSAALDQQLRLVRLESDLGLLMISVQKGNFGDARDRSSKFFDAVRAAMTSTEDPKVKSRLEAILANRDAITSDLMALNSAVMASLQAIFLQLHESNP